MTVTCYINWNDEEVINETQFKELLAEKTKEYIEDAEAFGEWLDDRYSSLEIWDLTETGRKQISEEWAKRAEEYASEDLEEYGWRMRTFTI